MGWMVWSGVLLACGGAAVAILAGPLRRLADEFQAERAREHFRRHREWLEADFLIALGRTAPTERLRWEVADWHDEVLWARDRQTRRLLALIGVRFDGPARDEPSATAPEIEPTCPRGDATAVFEYRGGSWHAEGKRIDEVRPAEAVRRNQRLVPVILHPRRLA
jgi:hypothetical protein